MKFREEALYSSSLWAGDGIWALDWKVML